MENKLHTLEQAMALMDQAGDARGLLKWALIVEAYQNLNGLKELMIKEDDAWKSEKLILEERIRDLQNRSTSEDHQNGNE